MRPSVVFGFQILVGACIASLLLASFVGIVGTNLAPQRELSSVSATPSGPGQGWTLTELARDPMVAVRDPVDLERPSDPIPSGAVPASTLHVLVTLQVANATRLSGLLDVLSNRESTEYHHFLTASEFDRNFSPPAQVVNGLSNYLTSHGAVQVDVSTDRLSVSFVASPKVVGGIFGTSIVEYRSSQGAFYAPTVPPQLPAPLADHVLEVQGLSSAPSTSVKSELARASRLSALAPAGRLAEADSRVASGYLAPPTVGGTQFEYAADFQVAYDEQSLFDQFGFPTGTVIASILWSGEYTGATTTTPYGTLAHDSDVGAFVPSDVAAFFNETLPAGEPQPMAHGVPILGAPSPGPFASWDSTGTYFENTLDLEMMGSTAPGALLYNVYGPTASTLDTDEAFSYILNPNASFPELRNVSVITNSWGTGDENDSAWFLDLEEAQARGITVLASTGDSADSSTSSKYVGGPDLTEFPSAVGTNTVGVVAVGGTTVTLASSLHLVSDVVWMENGISGGPFGSTGGVSSVFPEPAWQRLSEANAVLGGLGRGVPDVAGLANNTLVTISAAGVLYDATNASFGGPFYAVGGTSVASPLTAGVCAEIDHVLNVHQEASVGYLDPTIYALADREYSPLSNSSEAGYEVTGAYAAALPALPFLDVSTGANAVDSARPGYDLVTGWGSVDAYNLTMYLLTSDSNGVPGHLEGVRDVLNLTGLEVTARYTNGTTDGVANASVEQNMFLANGFGAPVFWVHDLATLRADAGGDWTITGVAWTDYPFPGLYASLTVDEFNASFSPTVSALPTTLTLSTSLSVPSGPESAELDFSLDGQTVSLATPGAAWILGNLSTEFSWQGVNYTDGPFGGLSGGGLLAPQFALVGGTVASTGDFDAPTAGGVVASVLPFGAAYVPAAVAVFGSNISQSPEAAENLTWTSSGSGAETLSTATGSPEQGVLMVEPSSATQLYPVNFTETGLPLGASWQVAVTGASTYTSTDPWVVFALPNATYPYVVFAVSHGYQATNASGSFSVVGRAVNVSEIFVAVSNTVTFLSSGLPEGAAWSVTLGPYANSSSTDTVGFRVMTGTYAYRVSPVAGFTTTNFEGSISVAGSNVAVLVPFEAATFLVTFTATGLPNGFQWSVSVDGVSESSLTTTILFTEPNGTYAYSVSVPVGYSAHAEGHTFTVNGSDVRVGVPVTTSSGPPAAPSPPYGLSWWEVGLAVALLAGVIGAIVVVSRRRRRRNDESTLPPGALR